MIFMKLSSMLWAMPLAQSEGPVDGENVGSLASWDWGYCYTQGLYIFFVPVVPIGFASFWIWDSHKLQGTKLVPSAQKKSLPFFPSCIPPFPDKSGPTPLRIPAPFLLTNRTKLRNFRRRNRSHPRLDKAVVSVSLDSGTFRKAKQTNKLLETKISSISKLTASKLPAPGCRTRNQHPRS